MCAPPNPLAAMGIYIWRQGGEERENRRRKRGGGKELVERRGTTSISQYCKKNCVVGVGVVICLTRDADGLRMVQLMPRHPNTPSSLAPFKSRLVLPFW